MSKRAVTLSWMLCWALVAGCPSEREAAKDNDGESGASGGDGDGDGDGESGDGGDSGDDGMSDVGTPREAASGMCGMMEDVAECTGVEAYEACLSDTCQFEQCWTGACAEYLECLGEADNACQASRDGTCEQPVECSDCLTADQNCVIGCFDELDCDEGTAGQGGGGEGGDSGEAGTGGLPEGTCDELDACCAALPEEESVGCTLAAESARMESDFACAVYIDAFCPADA